MTRIARLLTADLDSLPACAALGAGPDSPTYTSLDALADDIEAGRLDGGVVPYQILAVGRYEPTLDLLTRRRDIKVSATAVGDAAGGPVMFARLSRSAAPRTGRDRTILLAHLFDQQGILYKILRVIYEHDINIAHLNNRPDGRQGQYFTFDLECHADDPRFRSALAAIRERADPAVELEVLGSCPMVPFAPLRLRNVLLIGGTNGIGPLIGREFFEREGVSVTYAGRHTAPPYREIAKNFDCVMFAVPLDQTLKVIREIAPLCRPDAVLVDLASRKAEPVAAMLESAPAGCEVLGVHTVFGPATATVMGKNVIVTRTPRSGPLSDEIVGLFRKRGTVLTESGPAAHDRLMQVVQTQWHRLLLSVLLSGSESGLPLRAFLEASRPLDEGGLLIYLGARILTLGENLLWGLQTIDGKAGRADEPKAAGMAAVSEFVPRQLLERAAMVTDGAMFTLHRAQERRMDEVAPTGRAAARDPRAAALAACWARALLAEFGGFFTRGHCPKDLAEASSPHFLLGMLAACGLASGEALRAELLGERGTATDAPEVLSTATIGALARYGRRDDFVSMLTKLRTWLGEPFIKFAVEQTSRVFEQVLVEQSSALPRF